MGKPYDQQYLDTEGQQCGEMRCGSCNKPIESGEFRAAKKSANYDWHYVTHHRACCETDPGWAKKDKARKAVETKIESIARDVKNLLAKYPNEHDWVYEELREQLGYDE